MSSGSRLRPRHRADARYALPGRGEFGLTLERHQHADPPPVQVAPDRAAVGVQLLHAANLNSRPSRHQFPAHFVERAVVGDYPSGHRPLRCPTSAPHRRILGKRQEAVVLGDEIRFAIEFQSNARAPSSDFASASEPSAAVRATSCPPSSVRTCAGVEWPRRCRRRIRQARACFHQPTRSGCAIFLDELCRISMNDSLLRCLLGVFRKRLGLRFVSRFPCRFA